uniref:Uncharacterized protein n=1 Tax=Anguilla anguilla TaxID=7936 RepID=A0A0E9SS52_ANGAN
MLKLESQCTKNATRAEWEVDPHYRIGTKPPSCS